MQIVTKTRRLRRIGCAGLAALALGLAPLALAAPAASAQSTGVGWIRLAHLSPNTPAVDVYLESFGDAATQPVLHHVSYGSVSSFERVLAGVYAIAMRPAGAAASTTPVVSSSVRVAAGDAYTVAALGPASGLRLSVFTDPQKTPVGKALVQVIQASLRQNRVSVTAGGTRLASSLAFGQASDFVAAPAGSWPVRAQGPTENASEHVSLAAGTVHTLVVLDGQHGLVIHDLLDAAGSVVMPRSGVQTGFGGTASPAVPQPLWEGVGLAGIILLASGFALARRWPRHAR